MRRRQTQGCIRAGGSCVDGWQMGGGQVAGVAAVVVLAVTARGGSGRGN